MPETVDAWVRKAEGDYETAQRERAASPRPNFDAVCYHAQQCVEKLMKAALVHRKVEPPKSHNLLFLAGMLQEHVASWQATQADLEFLTRAGIAFRYPGEWATEQHASRALEVCDRLRGRLLELLQLDGE